MIETEERKFVISAAITQSPEGPEPKCSKKKKCARTFGGVTERGLDLVKPAELDAEGQVGPELVGRADLLEEGRIHCGSAADGEVHALPDILPLRLQVRRQQRQAERLRCEQDKTSAGKKDAQNIGSLNQRATMAARTKEVDDEAAVGAPARGAVEVGHAVGEAADDGVGQRAGHEQVAGISERVAEAEHGGVVALGAAAAAMGDPRE